MKKLKHANNWDLIDLTAGKILGQYLVDEMIEKNLSKPKTRILDQHAKSSNLWVQRSSIIATIPMIKHGYYDATIKIAKKLLKHEHDLIHKAIGWMLREVGKKDKQLLVDFLEQHISKMARTTLRYAIEKFSKRERDRFMKM